MTEVRVGARHFHGIPRGARGQPLSRHVEPAEHDGERV